MQIKENLLSNNSLRCPHQLDRYINFYFIVYMFAMMGSSQRYHCTALVEKSGNGNKHVYKKGVFFKNAQEKSQISLHSN